MRDYLWIEDAASSFLDAACLGEDNAKGQHYVIGSGTGYRIADVWSLIAEKISCKTGNTVLLDEISSEKLDAIEWRNFIADTSLFTKATGWKAGTSVDEGLERTIDALLITRNPAI
jgi:nucleoside-diphosphate-sugar epimerase